MSDCCSNAACEIDILRKRQYAVLKAVLGINIGMFGVEITAGWIAGSIALLADSLDMLGDALVYGFSLYVVARSAAWKAVSALIKGAIMCGFGLFVLGQALYKMFNPEIPQFETIGLIGLLALVANSVCFALLWRHRAEDINMHSVWLCSRNDIIANVAVLFAAVGVWALDSQWPDVLTGFALALLFLRSALHLMRDAIQTYKAQDYALRST